MTTRNEAPHVGAWWFCNGPYGGAAVVVEVRGPTGTAAQRAYAGGAVVMVDRAGAEVDLIYEDGREAIALREHALTCAPTPWRPLPNREPLDRFGIATLRATAALRKADEAAKADEARVAFVAALVALRAEHPDLLTGESSKDSLIRAATNLRRLLRSAYPGVKFSVKTRRFSGGDSLDVKWQGGPAGMDVSALANRFSAGTFDGMTDSYGYTRTPWNTLFGCAKYVSCYREPEAS